MSKLKQFFANKQLKNKIIYTLIILVIFRFLAHIPIPGVDVDELRKFFNQNQLFGLFNLFTGGAMKNFSVVMLGVGPYITASIIFQLLTAIIPSLEELSKEGEYGKQKINQYTRIATVPFAIIQSYSMIALLKSQGITLDLSITHLIIAMISMTAGTMLLMWLGELLTEKGIGNGLSIIISVGIIANLPTSIIQTINIIDTVQIMSIIGIVLAALITVVMIVFVNEAERRIPITYAKQVRGNKTYGGVDTHLPIRVNIAGVIPIIFAISMLVFPGVIANLFTQAQSETIANAARYIQDLFQNNLFYSISYFVLVIAFTFFYTSVVFKPEEIAKNIQRQGGFIPGIRPGVETSNYLKSIVSRIELIGALFLAVIAVAPYIVQSITGISTLVIGGTSILIIVSVIIETTKQIKAQMAMQTYDNF